MKRKPEYITRQASWDTLQPGDKIAVAGRGIQTVKSFSFEGDFAIVLTTEGYRSKMNRNNPPEQAFPNPEYKGK